MTAYWCEYAAVESGAVEAGVRVEVTGAEITSVSSGESAGAAVRLAGLTIPGFANCHSHAFHRALRGRTQRGTGSFWTWRQQMYSLAERLDPDGYYQLARAVYREMAATGITSVGEFHYLHHAPDGSPYDDPNAMGRALISAAGDAGIRITLLDTCYLAAGIDADVEGVQRRFSDGTAAGWQDRVELLRGDARNDVVVGAAIHSVRAVPRAALPAVSEWAAAAEVPLHTHLSEQVAENDAAQAAYGCSPTDLLSEGGVLGRRTSVVHATHLSERDIALIGGSGTTACFCPTTERDLGDGVGPARELEAAGSLLTLGSDSHAVIDPFEEMRALELDERLASQLRGHWPAQELLVSGTARGHASLGFPDVGRIAEGGRADLVTLDLQSARTAGSGPNLETVVFAAGAADVTHVVCEGRVVARREDRDQVGHDLAVAIGSVWGER